MSRPDVSRVTPPPHRLVFAGRAIVRTGIQLRYVHTLHGEEHVPHRGPVILASNHIGYLDGPMLFAMAPRSVHALVKEELFTGRLGVVLRRLGQIPVDRRHVDVAAVLACLRVLADGHVVGIFPEGERGLGDVARTRGGAAYLALVTGAPVVPVACLGTRSHGGTMDSMPDRGARVDTVFGAPVKFDPVPWPRTKQHVDDVRAEIQETLAAHVRAGCDAPGQTLPALPAKP